jgi:DNA-directed RNA polymerase sigma subunit (sigma70/sigma32)
MQINFVSKLVGGLIMAPTAALPTLTAEPGFTHYVEEIRGFPMLERQEEYMLAKRWREHGDIATRRTSSSPAICGS